MTSPADVRRQETLAAILARIPPDAWESIVRQEPEWQNLAPLLPAYGFGPFTDVMIVAGLNDYHLRGKAESVYWPPLKARLQASPAPESPSGLLNILAPFYADEPMGARKVATAQTFLQSPLAARLWRGTPSQTAAEFLALRDELARVMERPANDQQNVLAMKCLGLALLMAEEAGFDFSPIPIPADSRLRKLTKRLGFAAREREAVRELWQEILHAIQKSQPRVSMIHLDSLLWQITPLAEPRLLDYFHDLGAAEAGAALRAFLTE